MIDGVIELGKAASQWPIYLVLLLALGFLWWQVFTHFLKPLRDDSKETNQRLLNHIETAHTANELRRDAEETRRDAEFAERTRIAEARLLQGQQTIAALTAIKERLERAR